MSKPFMDDDGRKAKSALAHATKGWLHGKTTELELEDAQRNWAFHRIRCYIQDILADTSLRPEDVTRLRKLILDGKK